MAELKSSKSYYCIVTYIHFTQPSTLKVISASPCTTPLNSSTSSRSNLFMKEKLRYRTTPQLCYLHCFSRLKLQDELLLDIISHSPYVS